MAVREGIGQAFTATDWTDLRVGFYISATGDADPGEDDTITGLAETIGTEPRPRLGTEDRFFLGIGFNAVNPAYVNFLGYTNCGRPTEPSLGSSKLVSSDSGVGTSNTDYWRVKNEISDNYILQIQEGRVTRAFNQSGWAVHVPQVVGGGHAAGYASLVRLRFRRDDAHGRAKIIRMEAPNSGADAQYTGTPSAAALTSALQSFPTNIVQLGPVELLAVPNKLVWYWPWHNSSLRVHAAGIVKVT